MKIRNILILFISHLLFTGQYKDESNPLERYSELMLGKSLLSHNLVPKLVIYIG